MLTLEVTGMTCGGCASSVEKIVKALDPAASVVVDLPTGRVTADTKAPAALIVAAIEEAGFGAKAA